MNPGKYRHRLEIQVPTTVQDQDTGETLTTWTKTGTVWADIQPLRGRELTNLVGNLVAGEMDTKILVRWGGFTKNLTTAHRGVHQDAVFNFVAIAHIKLEQREVEIRAKSGVNDG